MNELKYTVEITKIIEGALKLDKIKVENYSNLLCEKLESDGEERVAKRIKKILNSNKQRSFVPSNMQVLFNTPVDQESRLPIADILNYNEIESEVILNDDISKQVNKFIENYKMIDIFSKLGLEMANTLLLFGPPGCGKTNLAFYIAKQLKLPIVIARLDSLISSYLGSTAKNIRLLFEYAEKTPCLLFLDEFDALAKARDDIHELGELKRVVNSLLQNIDNTSNSSVIIAATNHQHILDPAIWRRFEYRLEISLPDYESRKKMIKLFLKSNYELCDKDLSSLSKLFKGLTGAQIEEICKKSIRDSIINSTQLNIQCIVNNYFDFINIFSKIKCDNEAYNKKRQKELYKLKVIHIREKDKKFFSYGRIAELLNISKSYVGNLIREEKGE